MANRRTNNNDKSGGTPPDDKAIQKILRLLQAAGSDFSHFKRTTLLRRLERRMSLRRVRDLAAYASLLESDPAELKTLGEEILIHVTAFFREPDAFEAVSSTVFPALLRERPAQTPIRLWVPGCSTGEEVYSLAIALLDYLEAEQLSFPVQIFGTDVSDHVVARARRGKFKNPEVSDRQKRRHFTATEDGEWQVSKAIRELCVFASHDLTRDPPYSNIDLISCRNVLIYFDQPLQEKVIPIFHYALAPSGFLLLGPSESIDAFADLFTLSEKTHRIFAKNPVAGRLPKELFPTARPVPASAAPAAAAERPARTSDLAAEADRLILAASAPGVIVAENLDVVQLRGDVSPYLTPSVDKSGFNLAKAAHEGLLFPVTQAVEQAKKRRVPIVTNIEIGGKGRSRTVQLQVIPLPPLTPGASHFLVLFAGPGAPEPAGAEKLEDATPETRERYLERELQVTRQSLEAVIAKQQATNEELQSINEELRSRNEEYHSSLEELQTTHEELQSTNEELATLNEELRKRTAEVDEKNAQLLRSNQELHQAAVMRSRLSSIVESSDDAIIAKTLEGVIVSWNGGAEKVFGYTAAEAIGRPIEMLIPPGRVNEEPEILKHIRKGERVPHFETLRRRKDGTIIDVSVSISPIVDPEGKIVGASKIARDITERKLASARLEHVVAERTAELRAINDELESFCYAVAHDLRAPLRGISGFAQLLQDSLRLKSGSGAQRDFQRIRDNARRMSELITGLLELSRLTRQELVLESVDLSETAESIVRDLKGAAPRKGAQVRITPGLRARGDARLLRALLHNLLENSWKFTSKQKIARIEFGLEKFDGTQAFFVKDNGAGFDPAYSDKLFTAFHRLHHDEDFPGTGIGLATAKRIVARHGGRLWARGAVGKGAAFYFTLNGPTDPQARSAP